MGAVEKPMGIVAPMPVVGQPKRKKDKKAVVREAAEALVHHLLDESSKNR